MSGSRPLFHSHSRNSAKRSQPHSVLVPRPGELVMPAKPALQFRCLDLPCLGALLRNGFRSATPYARGFSRHLRGLSRCRGFRPFFYIPDHFPRASALGWVILRLRRRCIGLTQRLPSANPYRAVSFSAYAEWSAFSIPCPSLLYSSTFCE